MMSGVISLLAEAGIDVSSDRRGYRPVLSVKGFETKLVREAREGAIENEPTRTQLAVDVDGRA